MSLCPICNNDWPTGDRCPNCGVMLIGAGGTSGQKKRGRTSGRSEENRAPRRQERSFRRPEDMFKQEETSKTDVYEQGAEPQADVYEQEIPAQETVSEKVADPQVNTYEQETQPQETYREPVRHKAQTSEQSDEDLYGFGPARNSSRSSSSNRDDHNRYERRERREYSDRGRAGGGVNTQMLILIGAIIAAAVVVVIVAFLVIPSIKAKKAASSAETQTTAEQDVGTAAQENAAVNSASGLQTDFSWGDVNIDATVSGDKVVDGYFRAGEDSDYRLELSEAQNIAFTKDDTDVMLPNVTQLKVRNTTGNDLADYTEHNVTLTGTLYLSNDEAWYDLTGITSDEVTAAEAVGTAVGVHEYEFIVSDGSWEEDFNDALAAGGHLLTINDVEEYNYITNSLTSMDYTAYHVYLGGRRDDDGQAYYWVDTSNAFVGDQLNTPESWTNGYWYDNEPSFEDYGEDAQGGTQENRMGLFCVNGTWYLNDMNNNLVSAYPGYFEGKILYIIEYE